ncbi:MAG: tetratricopeptide repeat protein [Cyanobacteria bacterium P01_D01_bin.105]
MSTPLPPTASDFAELPEGNSASDHSPSAHSSLGAHASSHPSKPPKPPKPWKLEHQRSRFKSAISLDERGEFNAPSDFRAQAEFNDFSSAPDVHSLLGQGFELRNRGNYKGAIQRFDQAIAQNPNHAKSFLYRAQTYIQMRAYDAALNDFRAVLKRDPNNAKAWHGQGVAKAELKLYPSAVDSFERAIDCDPDNDKIWYNRGRALLKLEQYERALESFDQSVKLNGEKYRAWYNRALAQAALELIQPAIDSLERAIELKISCHYAWNYRGTLLNRLFKHEAALESFWTSLQHRVPNPNAWYGLASTYALLNNPESTAIHLSQAVKLNPSIYSLMALNDVNFDLVRNHPKIRNVLQD